MLTDKMAIDAKVEGSDAYDCGLMATDNPWRVDIILRQFPGRVLGKQWQRGWMDRWRAARGWPGHAGPLTGSTVMGEFVDTIMAQEAGIDGIPDVDDFDEDEEDEGKEARET